MEYPFVLPRGDHGAGSRKIRWLAQVSWWGAAVFSDQLVELLEVGEAGFRRDGLDAQIRVPEQLSGPTPNDALSNFGFRVERASSEEVRQRGSHMVMQRPIASGTITIPVPDHSELRTGTLRSIIRQSGLAVEEFR